jgi:hypothetical protein
MTKLLMAAGILIFLIIVLVVWGVFTKKAKLKKTHKPTVLKIPEKTKKVTDKPAANAAPLITTITLGLDDGGLPDPLAAAIAAKKEPLPEAKAPSPELDDEPIAAPLTNKPTLIPAHLPQDAMLRRHDVTHLRAIITELNLPRPTDSVLRRHYDAMLATQLACCLSDQAAVEDLTGCYQNHKKTVVQVTPKIPDIAESLSKTRASVVADTAAQSATFTLPEDSMLRRHALTQLYALVEANKPARPTDAALRRHYDAMIKAEVENHLGKKVGAS